jgi:hypothetical protein
MSFTLYLYAVYSECSWLLMKINWPSPIGDWFETTAYRGCVLDMITWRIVCQHMYWGRDGTGRDFRRLVPVWLGQNRPAILPVTTSRSKTLTNCLSVPIWSLDSDIWHIQLSTRVHYTCFMRLWEQENKQGRSVIIDLPANGRFEIRTGTGSISALRIWFYHRKFSSYHSFLLLDH